MDTRDWWQEDQEAGGEEGHDFVHKAQIPLLGTWVVCFHGTIFFKFEVSSHENHNTAR